VARPPKHCVQQANPIPQQGNLKSANFNKLEGLTFNEMRRVLVSPDYCLANFKQNLLWEMF
jgi:hypothetical protein